MSTLKQLLLSPIRFYPSLSFGNSTTFQNPDNRVSHGYNWDGVNSMPYALPIPKQWPDGQPGIDFMINAVEADGTFYADLYDSDDAKVVSLEVEQWLDLGDDIQYRVFLDCSIITDGYHTIKLFQSSDDAILLESEPLLIADFFSDMIPFEYSNFENDFGLIYDNDTSLWTGRILVPIKIYDPVPQFEKEVYKDDPGTLTTLRSTIQRVFNFDSLPVPVHVAELFSAAFVNSVLYLDRMKINSEEAPEAGLIEGSNLKQITGTATLVDFNTEYTREKVETVQTDNSIEWATCDYDDYTITGNSIEVVDLVVNVIHFAVGDSDTYAAEDKILIEINITDDGDSDLPKMYFNGLTYDIPDWGTNYFFYQFKAGFTQAPQLFHSSGKAVYTAVITVSLIT